MMWRALSIRPLGLAPAVRREVEAASLAALKECLGGGDYHGLEGREGSMGVGGGSGGGGDGAAAPPAISVRRCIRLKPAETRNESAWYQPLILKYAEPLTSFVLNMNLRRYISVHIRRGDACMRWAEPGDSDYTMGRPCYRTEHYVRAAEELAARYSATVALLATDDPGVLEEVRRLSAAQSNTGGSRSGANNGGSGSGGGSSGAENAGINGGSNGGSGGGGGGGRSGGSRPGGGLRWCQVTDPARAAVGGTQWTNAYTSDRPVDWETFPVERCRMIQCDTC